jgi:hypothetical protein
MNLNYKQMTIITIHGVPIKNINNFKLNSLDKLYIMGCILFSIYIFLNLLIFMYWNIINKITNNFIITYNIWLIVYIIICFFVMIFIKLLYSNNIIILPVIILIYDIWFLFGFILYKNIKICEKRSCFNNNNIPGLFIFMFYMNVVVGFLFIILQFAIIVKLIYNKIID